MQQKARSILGKSIQKGKKGEVTYDRGCGKGELDSKNESEKSSGDTQRAWREGKGENVK